MACQQSRDAEHNVMSAEYCGPKTCDECLARAFAQVGGFDESQAAGVVTPNCRMSLEKLFGDRWKTGLELGRKWAKRIEAGNKRKVTT